MAHETLAFTRINNDTNGNPRYVVHFLALCTREEIDASGHEWIPVSTKYSIAVKRANSIGGRKYNARSYGGGIVFQSYSIDETAAAISRITGRSFIAEKD